MPAIPKLVVAATLLAMVVLPVGALAAEPATYPLDLTSVGGPQLWLRCEGASLAECGRVSLWMQSNGVKGLQTTIFAHGERPWDPDMKLTP